MENLGNEENKEEIINKWAGILGTASSDKLDWMTQYAAAHSANESIGGHSVWGSQTATQSSSTSLFPMAVKVAAQTIGLDLVSVQPMGGDYTLLDKAKKKVTAVNRERQIDDILDDVPFEPLKIEETQEYQDYLKSGAPNGNLFYIDYQYGNATVSNTSNAISPKRKPFKPVRRYKKTK
jgi:hypothetical protein